MPSPQEDDSWLYPEALAGGGRVEKPTTFKVAGVEHEALPLKPMEEATANYMKFVGRPEKIFEDYPQFDEGRARKIAEAYDRMEHAPTDPRVKRAYDAMIEETLGQYKHLKDAGYDFQFIKPGEGDPYSQSPALGYLDLRDRGRLSVFPTDAGFGTLGELDVSANPLLKRVGAVGDLPNATANDAFRIVHDMYGHFGPGNPFFRHKGEERAWLHHSNMYSPEAVPAMTSETRGQNSWLNFGPYGERNRTAPTEDTVFADQKTGLMPEWTHEEYAGGGRVNRGTWTPLLDAWWHGSPSGDLRGGAYGLHLGTPHAAEQALEARIGAPAEGWWDGLRAYGETPLAGRKTLEDLGVGETGFNVGAPREDYYPRERDYKAFFGDRSLVPPDATPAISPYRLIGPTTNTPKTPYDDFKANGYMKAALSRGNARRGYYYKNAGEDVGSTSLVVPNKEHLQRYFDELMEPFKLRDPNFAGGGAVGRARNIEWRDDFDTMFGGQSRQAGDLVRRHAEKTGKEGASFGNEFFHAPLIRGQRTSVDLDAGKRPFSEFSRQMEQQQMPFFSIHSHPILSVGPKDLTATEAARVMSLNNAVGGGYFPSAPDLGFAKPFHSLMIESAGLPNNRLMVEGSKPTDLADGRRMLSSIWEKAQMNEPIVKVKGYNDFMRSNGLYSGDSFPIDLLINDALAQRGVPISLDKRAASGALGGKSVPAMDLLPEFKGYLEKHDAYPFAEGGAA